MRYVLWTTTCFSFHIKIFGSVGSTEMQYSHFHFFGSRFNKTWLSYDQAVNFAQGTSHYLSHGGGGRGRRRARQQHLGDSPLKCYQMNTLKHKVDLSIHRIQIWRTIRWAPRGSSEWGEASWASVLTVLLQKSLAWSVLYCYAFQLFFWMSPEGSEIFHRRKRVFFSVSPFSLGKTD